MRVRRSGVSNRNTRWFSGTDCARISGFYCTYNIYYINIYTYVNSKPEDNRHFWFEGMNYQSERSKVVKHNLQSVIINSFVTQNLELSFRSPYNIHTDIYLYIDIYIYIYIDISSMRVVFSTTFIWWCVYHIYITDYIYICI